MGSPENREVEQSRVEQTEAQRAQEAMKNLPPAEQAQVREDTDVELRAAEGGRSVESIQKESIVVINTVENLRDLAGNKVREAKVGEQFKVVGDLPPRGKYEYKKVVDGEGSEFQICVNDGERVRVQSPEQINQQESSEVNELIDSAEGINPVERFFLKNADELVGTAPDLVRMLPLIKSGNLEGVGEGLAKSENVKALLDSMKENLLSDTTLRQEFFVSLKEIFQKDLRQKLLDDYKGALAKRQIDDLIEALENLIDKPENHEPVINLVLNQKNLPKFISGDIDLGVVARVASGADESLDEVLFGLFEGVQMWGADKLNTGINAVKGWANEVTRYFGYEFEIQEELDLEASDIPDFISKPENAEKLATFLEENKDALEAAGRDVPILYMGVKAIINNDLDNPMVKALTENESLTEFMGKLREFVGKEPAFREELLRNAEAGVLNALKNINPEGTDWGAVEGEIKGLISANPEIQENFLDFVFLQFKKGSIVEAMQGRKDPAKVAGEILKVPFVRTLANNLSDKQKTPQLRNLIAEIGVNAGFNYAKENMKYGEDYKDLETELKQLAQSPRLQDALFNMLSSKNSAEFLQAFFDIKEGNLNGLSKLLKNENARTILEEGGGFLAKNPKAQEALLKNVLAKDERLKPLEGFLKRDPDGIQVVFDLLAKPDELSQVVDSLDPVLKEIEKEEPNPSVILAQAENLLSYPKIKQFVENIAADFQSNPDVWQETVDMGVDQVVPAVQDSVRDVLSGVLPESSLGAVNKALESSGKVLKNDPELQKSLINFTTKPGNIATIRQILKAKDNPVQLINTVGSNPALVKVIDQMKTALLADPGVRDSLTDAVLGYMDNISQLSGESTSPGAESAKKSSVSPEQILDIILANKNIKNLVDSTVDQIASPEWKEARGKMFAKGAETVLTITKNVALKEWKIDEAKWTKIEGALSKFLGKNENIQFSMLNLAKDFDAAKKFMNLGELKDLSVINHPEVKNILGEVAKFFTDSPDTWNLTVNTMGDAAIDTFKADSSETTRRKLKQDVKGSDLNAQRIFNSKTIGDILIDVRDMQGAGAIRQGWNGFTIAGHIGIDRGAVAATLLNPFN